MVLVAPGSATYLLLAEHLTSTDPSAMGRLLQGFFSGIGFLGGSVIFKGGTDVRGIKTAAAIWITGAIGLAIGTPLWWLGAIVGLSTATVLFIADLFPGTRQQIEQSAEQVERRIDRAGRGAGCERLLAVRRRRAVLQHGGALSCQLWEPLHRLSLWLHAVVGVPQPVEPVAVAWEEVDRLENDVILKRSADDYGLNRLNRAVAECLIGRIPGANR